MLGDRPSSSFQMEHQRVYPHDEDRPSVSFVNLPVMFTPHADRPSRVSRISLMKCLPRMRGSTRLRIITGQKPGFTQGIDLDKVNITRDDLCLPRMRGDRPPA